MTKDRSAAALKAWETRRKNKSQLNLSDVFTLARAGNPAKVPAIDALEQDLNKFSKEFVRYLVSNASAEEFSAMLKVAKK